MMNLNKNDRLYYQKKAGIYFFLLCIISVSSFKILFGFDSLYLGFFVDFLVCLISGPISFAFIGYREPTFYVPLILIPLGFLLFIRTPTQFKIFKILFSIYWLAWGTACFIAYVYF